MVWAARVGVISAMASLCALVAGNGCSASSAASPISPGGPGTDSGSPASDSSPTGVDSASGADSSVPSMDGGGTCFPGQVTNFMPTWHPPVGPYLGLCSDMQIVKLIAACFAPAAAQQTCDAWLADATNATCLGCWAGPASTTAASWAPFLYADNPGQSDYVNVAGCLELADPTQTLCAHALEAAFSCELAACLDNCSVPMSGTMAEQMAATNALQACMSQADSGGCYPLAMAAAPCIPTLDGGIATSDAGPATFCYDTPNDSDALRKYFDLACGPGPAEAGKGPDGG
jgi:hypothetical protein